MADQRTKTDGTATTTSSETYVDDNGMAYMVHRPPFHNQTLQDVYHSFVKKIVSTPALVKMANVACSTYVKGGNVSEGPSLKLHYTSTDGKCESEYRPVWPARGLPDRASWMKVGDNNQAQLVMNGIQEIPQRMKCRGRDGSDMMCVNLVATPVRSETT